MAEEYGLGDMAPHFEAALNPLHQIAIIAAAVLGRARELGIYDPGLPPMGYLEAPETHRHDFSRDSLNRRLQVEAVAVKQMPEPGHKMIFYDELCFQRTGLDLVFRSRSDDRIVIVEAKGTGQRVITAPLYYLRRTRTKGRQLSWDWVWRLLTDMAYDASTADGFFRVLRPLLDGRVERALVIARWAGDPLDADPAELRAFDEVRLSSVPGLDDFEVLDSKRQWLRDIDARGSIKIEELFEHAKSRSVTETA